MRTFAAALAVLGSVIAISSGHVAHAAPSEQSNQNQQTAASQKIVTVQPGDYLIKVAESNGSTAERVFFANTEIENPDLIYADQKVRIPAEDEQLTPREVPANEQIVAAPMPATPTAAPSRAQAAPAAVAAPRAIGSGCDWLRGRLAANGLSEGEISSALAIAARESGCNPQAVNRTSGACNVFQEYTCGKWGGLSDVDAHIRGADGYAKARYGGWAGAYSFWQANKWW